MFCLVICLVMRVSRCFVVVLVVGYLYLGMLYVLFIGSFFVYEEDSRFVCRVGEGG